MKSTPFMRFWSAINDQLRLAGRAEVTFGPARRLWLDAVRTANAA